MGPPPVRPKSELRPLTDVGGREQISPPFGTTASGHASDQSTRQPGTIIDRLAVNGPRSSVRPLPASPAGSPTALPQLQPQLLSSSRRQTAARDIKRLQPRSQGRACDRVSRLSFARRRSALAIGAPLGCHRNVPGHPNWSAHHRRRPTTAQPSLAAKSYAFLPTPVASNPFGVVRQGRCRQTTFASGQPWVVLCRPNGSPRSRFCGAWQ